MRPARRSPRRLRTGNVFRHHGSFLLLPDSLYLCAEHGWVWDWGRRGQCYSCDFARRRAVQERRNRVRRPPRLPFAKAAQGICRLCGTEVRGRRRTWCSDDCVRIWRMATSGGTFAHYWLSQEFGNICWVCWEEPGWEVDHVRPLWSLGDEERQELRWWLPFNLQLIGPRCHKAKTKREAAERAALKRARRVPVDDVAAQLFMAST